MPYNKYNKQTNMPKTLTTNEYKVIGESVKKTNRSFVKSYTEDYCKAITENYRQYHLRTLNGNLSGNYPEYARQQLDAIENGTANLMKFKIKTGKKFYKIVQMEFDTFQNRNEYREGSVHAFVNKKTGEVFKPASWQAPAKHVRFDLRIIKDREFLFNPEFTGWAGGYLYIR